jgi:hypothetical protein
VVLAERTVSDGAGVCIVTLGVGAAGGAGVGSTTLGDGAAGGMMTVWMASCGEKTGVQEEYWCCVLGKNIRWLLESVLLGVC